MKRKLPPDSEVWALNASGMTHAQIAERHGCTISVVRAAMDRWVDKPVTNAKLIQASTEDTTFVQAGAQPVAHRDTGNHIAGPALADGIYSAQYLDIHECGDLLREWGIA